MEWEGKRRAADQNVRDGDIGKRRLEGVEEER